VNVASILAATATGCVVLGYITKAVRSAYAWCQKLGKAMEQVQTRSAQLVPNGGSSMRDDIAAIREHLAQQDNAIADLKAKDEALALAETQKRRRVRR
jgi:small-conductance mechanosensitive channel